MGDSLYDSTSATPREIAVEQGRRADDLTTEIEQALGASFRAGWIAGYVECWKHVGDPVGVTADPPGDHDVIRAYTRFLAASLGGDPGIVQHVERDHLRGGADPDDLVPLGKGWMERGTLDDKARLIETGASLAREDLLDPIEDATGQGRR